MGCGSSSAAAASAPAPARAPRAKVDFAAIKDRFETIEQVQEALRTAGLESSSLVLGIDMTQSNTWTGQKSFYNQCLHTLNPAMPNPYQQCIHIIGRTLAAFDDDGLIPIFGFGDSQTTDKGVFSFGDGPARGFEDALARYAMVVPGVRLSGPTSFAPIIRKTIELVRTNWQYTILLIIADGAVSDPAVTAAAIEEASHYPISIVVLGVGDGPFDLMESYDDTLPSRKFDNFQFVNVTRVMSMDSRYKEPFFAMSALMEVPEQYKSLGRLRMLTRPAGSM